MKRLMRSWPPRAARRVMSHEYGSTQFDIKIQMSWFLPGSTIKRENRTFVFIFHRIIVLYLLPPCLRARIDFIVCHF
jgi:hypothetical protein